MPTPDFVLRLRHHIGHELLWLTGVTAVITRTDAVDSELLLVRRSDNGAWTPVTGIIDPGEQPATAAAREAWEEARVQVEPRRLARVHSGPPMVYPHGDRAQYLDLTFHCVYRSGEAAVGDDENAEVRWFGQNALPPLSAEMRNRIDSALHGGAAAEFLS